MRLAELAYSSNIEKENKLNKKSHRFRHYAFSGYEWILNGYGIVSRQADALNLMQ